MATKIIKLHDNNTTYVPVTLAKAVQFTYNTNKAMSVQEAIEQVAGSALSISSSVVSNKQEIDTHVGYNDIDFSYTSGTGVKISGVHTAKTKILKGEGLTYIKESGNNIIIGTTATNNTGTVTKVSTTGAISGGDITTTGTISHVKQGPSTTGNTSVQQNSANGTLSEGKSFKVAKLTINEYGHVTAASDVTYTMPSSFTPSAHDHTMTLSGSDDTTAQANNLVSVIKTLPGTLTTENSNAYTTYTVPTKEYVDDAVSGAFADVASALKYQSAVNSNSDLPSDPSKGDVYVVATAGQYAGKACEVGDYLIWDGTKWDALNGENQVTNYNVTAKVNGSAVNIAQVDGTYITVQVSQDDDVVYDSDLTSYVNALNSTVGTGVVTGAKLETNGGGKKLTLTYTDLQTKQSNDGSVELNTTGTTVTTSVSQASNGKITVSGTTIKVDHTGTGTAGKLTYWNGTTTHTAVTNSYGNSSTKYAYVDGGVLKEGTLPIFTNSNDFAVITAGTDSTVVTGGTANTGSATADAIGDTLTVQGGNKWITTGVTDTSNNDTLIINHAINSTSFAKTTADVYSIKIDNAGHITEATAAATGTVGINSLSYSVSSAPVDEFILFDGTWGTANNIADLTGDTTFVK